MVAIYAARIDDLQIVFASFAPNTMHVELMNFASAYSFIGSSQSL